MLSSNIVFVGDDSADELGLAVDWFFVFLHKADLLDFLKCYDDLLMNSIKLLCCVVVDDE
jgi:hypothetical protein